MKYPLLSACCFGVLLCFAECTSAPEKRNRPANPGAIVTVEETATGIQTDEALLTRYDRVKAAALTWNAAIDKHDAGSLPALYADRVECYLKTQTRQECVDAKNRWLQTHAGYRQGLDNLQVYYFDEDTLLKVFVAEFDKVCRENGKTTTVPSFLYFSNFGRGWQIFRETDAPTEVQRAAKAPVYGLAPGEYTFSRSYQMDTRDIPDFAHENVPYDFSLHLTVDENITGRYMAYSGTLRSTTNYLVPEGKVEDGILELTVVYVGDEDVSLEEYNPEETIPSYIEHYYFKILDGGKELLCLDEDKALYGKSLWLVKP